MALPMWQTLLAHAINHYASQVLAKILDWLREVPDAEIEEACVSMSVRDAKLLRQIVDLVRAEALE